MTYRLDGQWLTNGSKENDDERRGTRRSAKTEKEKARG